MKDITICLFVIGVIIFGIILMILASAFGLGRRVGPWLVRGKYWLIRKLGEGRQMGVLDFLFRTGVRIVVLPVAVVHDTVTMGGAVNNSRCMVGDIIKDTVKDAQNTVDEVKP